MRTIQDFVKARGTHRINIPPYRPGTNLTTFRLNIVMDAGGLGDMIARTPAIIYLLVHNPHIRVRLWCPEYFLELAHEIFMRSSHPIYDHVEIMSVSDYSVKCDWDEPHFSFKDSQHTGMSTNLTRHAFNLIVNKEVSEEHLVYPKLTEVKANKESNYIVLTPNATAQTREMPQSLFIGLLDWAKRKNFKVYLLGKAKTLVKTKTGSYIESFGPELSGTVPDHVIDMRDQTTLLEAWEIIAMAHCLIGYDNGLIHLAGLTNVPLISIFTNVDPMHRKIYRHTGKGTVSHTWRHETVVPPESLSCRFCQSHMGMIYGHRFRQCFYEDYQCTKHINLNSIDLAYQRILKQLENE